MRAGCYRRGNRFTTRKLSSTIPGSISPTAFPLRGRCLLCVLRVEQFHPGSCRRVLSSRSPHRGMWFTSAMREMIVSCLATTWRSESRSVCSCATSLLRPPISLAASLSACAMAACSPHREPAALRIRWRRGRRTWRVRRGSRAVGTRLLRRLFRAVGQLARLAPSLRFEPVESLAFVLRQLRGRRGR